MRFSYFLGITLVIISLTTSLPLFAKRKKSVINGNSKIANGHGLKLCAVTLNQVRNASSGEEFIVVDGQHYKVLRKQSRSPKR